MIPNTLPQGLIDNPRLDQWVDFQTPGRVRIMTGKVELGQGILTAIVQIAADELDVEPGRIEILTGDTAQTPAEGITSGSLSVQMSGGSMRLVGAEVRSLMLAAAAARLQCPSEQLSVIDGVIARSGVATGLDYWQLAPTLDLKRNATGAVPAKAATDRRWIGRSLPRIDLPAKVFGAGAPFIHDYAATLHARILRQPWPGASLSGPSDEQIAARLAPAAQLLRRKDFVAVVASDEAHCVMAAVKLAPRLQWTGGQPIAADAGAAGWVATQPSNDTTEERGRRPVTSGATTRITQRYTKPFIAHASIGPSCALARFENGQLMVWTHSQGVGPLRVSLSRALKFDAAQIRVAHLPGAGCYGHNGADDVAADAAIIALERPGETVRVQWSREDELAAAPFGSAMAVEVSAEIGANGLPISWTTDIWSGPHAQRPGAGGGVNLLAPEAMPDAPARPVPTEIPDAAGGSATRNAWLLYDVPHQVMHNHIVPDVGPRTSSMRGLGAFANVIAIECFMDELAAAAKADPVAYRLAMLSDPRARAVVERAASMANWRADAPRREGYGRGIAYSRYKNRAGYCALVVDVRVDDEVRLERIWCAADAGLAINPDGVRNQVEGGIIQAASWALKEQVLFESGRVASRSWETYPILRFSEVPPIEIDLIEHANQPTLGMGEVSQGPTGAAIANAVADALGVRVRDLPLTRERIMAALM